MTDTTSPDVRLCSFPQYCGRHECDCPPPEPEDTSPDRHLKQNAVTRFYANLSNAEVV